MEWEERKASKTVYVNEQRFEFVQEFYRKMGMSVSVSIDAWLEFFTAGLEKVGYDPETEMDKRQIFDLYLQVMQEVTKVYQAKLKKGIDRFDKI